MHFEPTEVRMFKRVVRRALDARKGQSEAPKPEPTPARAASVQANPVDERPRSPKSPNSAPTSIAERIAAGNAIDQAPRVSATSGALQTAEGALHMADDGTQYWGPVDNECSRAKAQGHT